MMCSDCVDGKCGASCPSAKQPQAVDCPGCDEKGCGHCNDGSFYLTECPQLFAGEMVDAIQLVDMHKEHGMPPIAGGSLDQSKYYLNLYDETLKQRAYVEREKNAGA